MLLCFSADCLLDGQQSTEKRNPYQCSIYIVYLLMMLYKYVRNMQRLIDEINWGQIVHRVGFVKRKQTDSDTRKSVYMNLQICSENLQSCTSKENDDTHTHIMGDMKQHAVYKIVEKRTRGWKWEIIWKRYVLMTLRMKLRTTECDTSVAWLLLFQLRIN